ncbi:MAG: deoxyribodipyrimidine photo-lyase [Salinivirgaceae bacterium]
MEKQENINLFWFRRDLRLTDNTGLYQALKSANKVQPLFIFDSAILDDLTEKRDRRVSFIYETIAQLKKELVQMGSDVWVFYGNPLEVFKKLLSAYKIASVYVNHDYEPYAIRRDAEIKELCETLGTSFLSFKDQVIFEKNEVVKDDNKPYTVFTPYMRQWKKRLAEKPITAVNTSDFFSSLNRVEQVQNLIAIAALGFQPTKHGVGHPLIDEVSIKNYHLTRNDLSLEAGTTQVSVHLRFGTVSIRQLVKKAIALNETYLNELIWREFYMQILWHFPQVVTQSFKPAYDKIPWNTRTADFEKWCQAKTGYPIVDAAMNQLLQTGQMHNRARMIVASFLTKHLLIDWRKGEAFFGQHLTDYELSSNNGGWQWAAGSGCDAAPYFRIFNPYTQAEKFDAQGIYINRWGGNQGLEPIIAHQKARERCLSVYKNALNQ